MIETHVKSPVIMFAIVIELFRALKFAVRRELRQVHSGTDGSFSFRCIPRAICPIYEDRG